MKLYNYQERILSQLSVVLENKEFAYLQMPTGTGKTLTTLKFLEKNNFKNVVWLCGSVEIVDQARKIHENFKINSLVVFTTWQSLRNCKKDIICDFLVIDEIHYGGSLGENKAKSIDTILNYYKPKKRLYLSASPWNLQTDVLGSNDNIVKLDIFECLKNNYINDVKLIQNIIENDLLVKQVEKLTKCSIEELQNYSFDEVINKFKDKEIAINIRRIVRERISSMVNLFLKYEKNNQVIFFCPKIEDSEYCVELINKLAGKIIASSIHSEKINSSEIIDNFKTNDLQVIVACQMLVHGFDYPKLEVIFDCSYSRYNVRRNYQKIGRILRINKNKKISRYYYAKDILNYVDRSSDQELNTILAKEKEALYDYVSFIKCIGGGDTNLDKELKIDRDPDFISIKFSDFINILNDKKDGDSFVLSDFLLRPYEHSPEKKKEELLKRAEEGYPKPKRLKVTKGWDEKLSNAFYSYTNPSKPLEYDPVFTSKLISIRPDWLVKENQILEQRNKDLFEYASDHNNPKPNRRSKDPKIRILYTTFSKIVKFRNKNHKYNFEIIKKLRPEWIEFDKSKIRETKYKYHKNVALKFNLLSEFKKTPSYKWASWNGHLREFTRHMKRKFVSYDNKIVKIITKEFKTKQEWRKLSPGSYRWAKYNKCVDKFTKHMKK